MLIFIRIHDIKDFITPLHAFKQKTTNIKKANQYF